MTCSICLYAREGVAEDAVTVINGQAVCEDHMDSVQGDPHIAAVKVALRDEALRRRADL